MMITTWAVITTIAAGRSLAYDFRPLHDTDDVKDRFKKAITGHVILAPDAEYLQTCEVWFISFDDNGHPKYERVC